MPKYECQDHYLDRETGVLKNKLGIGEEGELNKAEASLVAWRAFQLFQKPIRGRFDLDHLKAIHKHLFQDVYEWAGELRDIDLSKGKSYFANHAHIASAAQPLFEKLAEEGCLKGFEPAEFSERAAYYLGGINALHPFREGNGRAQREFINHLAYANGYFIEWKNVSAEEMIQASQESFQKGDNTKFTAFIRDNLKKLPTD
ncbi:MAG TPA: Fic family protein, partial [Syntrophobacteraceae bacterium]|nr:Fic family protein [Syntrophobacteraceae bacterium]